MRAREFISESDGAITSGSIAVVSQPLTTMARMPNIDKYYTEKKQQWMNSRTQKHARKRS